MKIVYAIAIIVFVSFQVQAQKSITLAKHWKNILQAFHLELFMPGIRSGKSIYLFGN